MSGRDWKAYNESLVRRGEILLDLGIVKGWRRELAEMNEGKEGARYQYSLSLIKLLAFIARGILIRVYHSTISHEKVVHPIDHMNQVHGRAG
jgi:hypothetical protein